MNKSIHLLLGGLTLLGTQSCSNAHNNDVRRPNVIYVFPDQYRNHAMNFWGEEGFRDKVNFTPDPVYTPNLDKFARESVVLTSAMSNCPLSSPHRGMLLSGMYPNKSGIPLNCNSSRPISGLHKELDCIGDVFNRSGYDCAYFGKLHTDFPTKNDPENPGHYVEARRPAWDAYTPKDRRHGFNFWYSYGTFDQHKNPHYWDTEGKKHEPKEWSPIHEAKQVVAYLENKENQRNPDKPFFIMVGMNPPHSPYRTLDDCEEEDFNLYKDIPLDSLLVRPNADPKMDKAHSTPYYFASVTGVDRAFGQILQTLKELDLDENTIVIFSSDHGETMCSHGMTEPKNSPYAEAFNVPFIVRYPNKIKPRVDDLMISTPDVMPTILGLCGLTDSIPETLQGRNLSALFFNKDADVIRPDAALYIKNLNGKPAADGLIHSYFPVARGLKTARYTFALYIDEEKHQLVKSYLFDDVNDPYQMNNLPLDQHPQLVKELCEKMGTILKEIDDPWYNEKILPEYVQYN